MSLLVAVEGPGIRAALLAAGYAVVDHPEPGVAPELAIVDLARAERPAIPPRTRRIVLVGFASRLEPATAWLVKPVDPDELVATVRRCLAPEPPPAPDAALVRCRATGAAKLAILGAVAGGASLAAALAAGLEATGVARAAVYLGDGLAGATAAAHPWPQALPAAGIAGMHVAPSGAGVTLVLGGGSADDAAAFARAVGPTMVQAAALARLRARDALATLGTIAAGLAHEINNPTAFVLANLRYLVRELDGRELDELAELVRESVEGMERIRDVVKGVASFAATDDRVARISVTALLDRAALVAQHEIKYRARVDREYAPDLPAIESRPAVLTHLFVSLILAAAHAVAEGDVERNWIVLRAAAAPGGVRVEIADTGASPAREPLGFATCRELVRELGGELQVGAGAGTTVTIVLPLNAP